MSTLIENLETRLAEGNDSGLLRFSLGAAYLKQGDEESAVTHLQRAVELDGGYSAAWKLLSQAHAAAGNRDAALHSYRHGIAVAEEKGDIQAAKEMRVFLRRLERAAPQSAATPKP